MAATESIAQQLVVALRDRLRTIDPDVDGEYWYKPDVVKPADVLDSGFITGASTKDHIVLLGPGDEYSTEGTTGTVEHAMEVFIMCSRQWNVSVIDPIQIGDNDTTRWLLQNRMVRDVLRAILQDVTFGGLCSNCNILDIMRNYEFPEKWAIAIILVRFSYDFMKDAP